MFSPEVVQVIPHEDYTVDVFFHDGKIVKYDARHLLNKGVFSVLTDKKLFVERCTVMNHTLAWDVSGKYDPTDSLDLDPEVIYGLSDARKDSLT